MLKAFEKQTKTIEYQGKKQADAIKSLKYFDKQWPSIANFISNKKANRTKMVY